MAGKTIKLDTGTVYKKTADGIYFFLAACRVLSEAAAA